MKLINKIYRIDVYNDEVELLSDLLTDAYRRTRDTLDHAAETGTPPAQVAKLEDDLRKLRKLRNEIGSLINRSYMGSDA